MDLDEVDTEPNTPVVPFEPPPHFIVHGDRERYGLIERLGTGGMGEVWACADRRVERAVAMKIM